VRHLCRRFKNISLSTLRVIFIEIARRSWERTLFFINEHQLNVPEYDGRIERHVYSKKNANVNREQGNRQTQEDTGGEVGRDFNVLGVQSEGANASGLNNSGGGVGRQQDEEQKCEQASVPEQDCTMSTSGQLPRDTSVSRHRNLWKVKPSKSWKTKQKPRLHKHKQIQDMYMSSSSDSGGFLDTEQHISTFKRTNSALFSDNTSDEDKQDTTTPQPNHPQMQTTDTFYDWDRQIALSSMLHQDDSWEDDELDLDQQEKNPKLRRTPRKKKRTRRLTYSRKKGRNKQHSSTSSDQDKHSTSSAANDRFLHTVS
jgi:hypothetical protein